jgi:hypothetical protein
MTFTELSMPTEPFSVKTLQTIFQNGLLKDHLDAVYYIEK